MARVLLANKFFFPKGGAETVFFQERKWLKDHGWDVVDFSMRHAGNEQSRYEDWFVPHVDYHEQPDGGFFRKPVQQARTGLSVIHNRIAVRRVRELVNRTKPDIAHLHNIYHQITPSIIPALKDLGVPTVLTLHDYKIVCPVYTMFRRGDICTRCEGKRFYNVLAGRCLERSLGRSLVLALEAYFHLWRGSYDGVDMFVAPSEFMRRTVSRFRVDADRVRVIVNGIVPGSFPGQGGDLGYGLYLGRISKEKGVETLLKAHAELGGRVPLKIAGTGPLEGELAEAYPEAEFTGHLTGRALGELLRNSGFVVVPSEWYENCSMSVLEAMACGKPVIASDIGGLPEQVEDGVSGLLFRMGDAVELAGHMKVLGGDRALRLKMGAAARRRVEADYSLRAHAEALATLYGEILAKAGKS